MCNARTSGLLAVLLLLTSAGFSQEAEKDTSRSAFLGPPLVAWSELQKPRPAPQQQVQLQPLTVFVGVIEKEGGGWMLESAGGTQYALDDEKRAESYLGKRVRVVAATQKAESGSLHVMSIDALE